MEIIYDFIEQNTSLGDFIYNYPIFFIIFTVFFVIFFILFGKLVNNYTKVTDTIKNSHDILIETTHPNIQPIIHFTNPLIINISTGKSYILNYKHSARYSLNVFNKNFLKPTLKSYIALFKNENDREIIHEKGAIATGAKINTQEKTFILNNKKYKVEINPVGEEMAEFSIESDGKKLAELTLAKGIVVGNWLKKPTNEIDILTCFCLIIRKQIFNQ